MDEKFKTARLPKALQDELRRLEQRPTWESLNEGVHERVSFDDTIWGFNLAGGAYYNTPLRVTQVKEDSRAQRAGIKVGDMLRCINEIDSSKLTIQAAHDLILQSGIEIRLSFIAPDVDETMYNVYQDEYFQELEEARRRFGLNDGKKRKVFKGAKTNNLWSNVWPCNKKRDVMYRESNCFMIPSRYEKKHPDKIKAAF